MSANTIMFPGAGDVYVKFHDIIGTPRVSILLQLIRGRLHPGLFHFSFLEDAKIGDIIQWYVHRKYENYLDDPMVNVHGFTKEENERLMQLMLADTSYLTFAPFNLETILILHPIVDRLHLYSKYDEQGIHETAARLSHQVPQIDCPHGSFPEIIKNAKDHATLITTSTEDVRTFLNSKYENRYAALIYPNEYDSIKQISDVYSKHSDRLTVLDITKRIKIWEESIL